MVSSGKIDAAALKLIDCFKTVDGWGTIPQELHPILPGSSIAAASSDTASSTASNNWNEVISLSSSGFKIDTGPDGRNNWLEFGNLPAATSSNVTYSSFAVTALGRVFVGGSMAGEPGFIQS
jgi:hypothetical protein